MKKISGSPLFRILFSPVGLIVLVGLAGGLFVSDLFRGIAMRQAPPPEIAAGPQNATQAPLAYSETFRPDSDNGIVAFRAERIGVAGGQTTVMLAIRFHRRKEYSFYQIGSYEPPALVDKNGGLLLGTVEFPANRHFSGGETFRTLITFPGTPASFPVTLSLFMGERYAGQYHMTPISLTGLSPSNHPPAPSKGSLHP
jgi:hypothetical protein